MADVGYNLMAWVQNQDEYRGLAMWIWRRRIPSRADYAARYCAARGCRPRSIPM
jgi:aminoglycoside phosphotransferase (APT) family kinase protein